MIGESQQTVLNHLTSFFDSINSHFTSIDSRFNDVERELRLIRADIFNQRARSNNANHLQKNICPLRCLHPRNIQIPIGIHNYFLLFKYFSGSLPSEFGVPFPATIEIWSTLTAAELDQLEIFYGEDFSGATIEARRGSFRQYILPD
jgi:hypothetical protein